MPRSAIGRRALRPVRRGGAEFAHFTDISHERRHDRRRPQNRAWYNSNIRGIADFFAGFRGIFRFSAADLIRPAGE